MNKDHVYYVYLHRRASDNEVFYVGKGKGRRAFKNDRRSDLWNHIKNKHGLIIELYKENLSEQEALNIEMVLIKEYGRIDLGTGNLVNFTDGGDTTNLSPEARRKISEKAKNRVVSDETRRKLSTRSRNRFYSNPHIALINRDGSEISGKFSELMEHFGRDFYSRLRNVISGRTKSFSGWMLNSGEHVLIEYRERLSRTKGKLFTFVSETDIVQMSKAAFSIKYNIKTSPLFVGQGRQRVVKGWVVLRGDETVSDVVPYLDQYGKGPKYLFANQNTGESFLGTAADFSIYSNIKKSTLCDLFRKTPRKIMGWYIKEKNATVN